MLLLGGTGTTVAALALCYVLRREANKHSSKSKLDDRKLFKVTDPKGCSIGIRETPDVNAAKTGHTLNSGDVFEVSEIVDASSGQQYLRLADGRGWAFTHSNKDGRVLASVAPSKTLLTFQDAELLSGLRDDGKCGSSDSAAMRLRALHGIVSESKHLAIVMRQRGAIEAVAAAWKRHPGNVSVAGLSSSILLRYATVHADALRKHGLETLVSTSLCKIGACSELADAARLWARIGIEGPTTTQIYTILQKPYAEPAIRPLLRVAAKRTIGRELVNLNGFGIHSDSGGDAVHKAAKWGTAWEPLLRGAASTEAMLLLSSALSRIPLPPPHTDNADLFTDSGMAACIVADQESDSSEPGEPASVYSRPKEIDEPTQVTRPCPITTAAASSRAERNARVEAFLAETGREVADPLTPVADSKDLPAEVLASSCAEEDPDAVKSTSATEFLEHTLAETSSTEKWPVLFPGPGDNVLKFSTDFDAGNLRRVRRDDSGALELMLNCDAGRNTGFWFFFEVSATIDVEQRFRFVNFSKPYSTLSDGQRVVVRGECDVAWHRAGWSYAYYPNRYAHDLDTPVTNPPLQLYTLAFKLKLRKGKSRIAYCYPYSAEDLRADLRVLLHEQDNRCVLAPVQPDFIDIRDIGPTPGGRQLPMFVVTDFGVDDCEATPLSMRPRIVLSARVHPGETPASHVMRGAIEMILSRCDQGQNLRRTFVFLIFPMLNPDGVSVGHGRGDLAGRDMNRLWECPPAGSEIARVKAEIAGIHTKCPGSIFTYIDLHAHSCRHGISTLSNPGNAALPDLLQRISAPAFDRSLCTFTAAKGKRGSARCVMWREFGVQHAHTIEASYARFSAGDGAAQLKHLTTSDFREFGRCMVLACDDLFLNQQSPETQGNPSRRSKTSAKPKQRRKDSSSNRQG